MKYIERFRRWWHAELRAQIHREAVDTRLYQEAVASEHVTIEHRTGGVLIKVENAGVFIPTAKCEQIAKELRWRGQS